MVPDKGKRFVRRTQEQQWRDWVKKKIIFYISTAKWDNVTIPQLNAWLANFDEEGQKYALSLLNYFIYYSEVDVKRLCWYALTNVVFRGHIVNVERTHDFLCRNESLLNELKERIKETYVVPLLSEGNPTESGNAIARLYTTTGLIAETQVIRPEQMSSCIDQGVCKRFLFVDDFLGSGDQLDSFWNKPCLPSGNGKDIESCADIAAKHTNISFEYVTLVATAYGLQNAALLTPSLRIHYCEQLSDEYRVFSDQSVYFRNENERKACKAYLETLCYSRNIHMWGYKGLDFAIAFHHGTPDSCLPIFWEENDSWARLFKPRM